MKNLFIIGLLAAGIWYFLKNENAIAELVTHSNPTEDFTTIIDGNGRELSCKVTAKKKSFIRIKRETDGSEFTISVKSLSEVSQKKISRISDFNESSLKIELLKLASKEITPELLYIPELCTFRCQYSGQRMKSSEGMLVDAFRDYLRDQGFKYKEVTLKAEKAGNGGFYMPEGISSTPCIRVGGTLIYKRNREKIQNAIVEYYMASSRG